MWPEHFEPPDGLCCFVWDEVHWRQLLYPFVLHIRMKKRYLNSISVMSSHGEYPSLGDRVISRTLWCPYHFRARNCSTGQSHLMETWFHKVQYFIFVLEPKAFSWCEVRTKETWHALILTMIRLQQIKHTLDLELWAMMLSNSQHEVNTKDVRL